MTAGLRVPCAYQGGKQRIASQIADTLIAASHGGRFYDLCCGSGAISIELVNRGIDMSRITMLDRSSWGVFWKAIGDGSFDMGVFDGLLEDIPMDKRLVKDHMTALSSTPIHDHEAELYPVLQSCSFGGKQIWKDGDRWVNAFFRNYWEPTATSVRRSPANPMQPSPKELRRRVSSLVNGMRGISCIPTDVTTILEEDIPSNAVVYMDPPYDGTTGYGFEFDVTKFASKYKQRHQAPLFVSEETALSPIAVQLVFGGAKGGISGRKAGKHQEWLSRF